VDTSRLAKNCGDDWRGRRAVLPVSDYLASQIRLGRRIRPSVLEGVPLALKLSVPLVIRRLIAGLFSAIAATLMMAISAGVTLAESRIALVIGNGSYAESRLKNPRSDAGLMARTLAATGFDVMTVMDGRAEDMRRAIAEFGSRLQTPGAVALFYYAGHGVQIDGDNYLIPLGADISGSNDVSARAVPLQSVLRTMARSGSRLNIVVLDACRDNPFTSGEWTATVTGLASVVAPSGTIIAYSTGPGEIAQDGSEDNSPYTGALAREMMQPGATLEDVFRATRRHVLARTRNQQTPWEHSSLVSQFSFVAPLDVAGDGTARLASQIAEMEAWETIKNTLDAAVLLQHLQRFPEGLFSELVAVRIAKIAALKTGTPWSWIATSGIGAGEQIATATITYQKALMMDADGAPAGDLSMAAKLYAEAAEQGLPAAIYRVGRGYDKGRGVPRDQIEAARWYERAAVLRYPPAMSALGTMHEYGDGAALNLAEALRLYRLAADAGDAAGMTSLAFLYSEGKGVARNVAEARRLYDAAASQDHPRAMFNLALMSLKGQGAASNPQAALKLLQSAARLGHSGALLELARLSDRGLYVVRDPVEAAGYILKAAQASSLEGRKLDFASFGWSFATKRQIQKDLAAQGLYSGMAHGFFNAATREALIAVAGR